MILARERHSHLGNSGCFYGMTTDDLRRLHGTHGTDRTDSRSAGAVPNKTRRLSEYQRYQRQPSGENGIAIRRSSSPCPDTTKRVSGHSFSFPPPVLTSPTDSTDSTHHPTGVQVAKQQVASSKQTTTKKPRKNTTRQFRPPRARVHPSEARSSPTSAGIVCQTAFQGICFPPFPGPMSLPPKFWSDLLRTTTKRDSVVNIAVIGPPECGKSTFIRKAVKNLYPQALPPIRRRGYSGESLISISLLLYRLWVLTDPTRLQNITVACTLAALDPPSGLETTRILEINSAILSPHALWLEGWPRLDAVILCYDASNPESFKRIPELIGG